MSSGKKRESLRGLLKVPFRRQKSRSPSPSPTPASPSGLACSNTPPGSPNPQSLATSGPVRNKAFQKAIQEYIDNLPDDDKMAFQSATDVMERIGELQKDKSRTSSSHPCQVQRVQKVLQCVKLFLVSVAICIQQNPEISSLVVGGLNCILTVSTYLSIPSSVDTGFFDIIKNRQNNHLLVIKLINFSIGQLALGYIGFFENLIEMMGRIGDHLTYLTEYATDSTFEASEGVHKVSPMYCEFIVSPIGL